MENLNVPARYLDNISADECSSEVSVYLLSRLNDPPLDAVSNTVWVEDCLEKSEKHVTEREQLSGLATQRNQLTITSNQQMVDADVHDRKEAVSVRKSSGAFKQLQHPLEIQVDKQRDGEYRRTLSAEARPFVAFQANKEKVNYFNKKKLRKSKLSRDSRWRNTVPMDLPDDYSGWKKEAGLPTDAWINQLSVPDRERLIKLISMDHLSMTWLMQQNLPRIQIPVFDRSPTKWLESVGEFKDLVHDLQVSN